MEVSIVMGVPQARWMVYVMENPNLRWMIPGGTPVFWKPSQDPYIIPYYPIFSDKPKYHMGSVLCHVLSYYTEVS